MTTFRIKELESLGFEWDRRGAVWEDRFSELADYRKIHRHCSVPRVYSENPQLGQWVGTQRKQYKLHLEVNKSFITLPRIQVLESLDFEWTPSISRGKGTPKNPSIDEDAMRACEMTVEAPEHATAHQVDFAFIPEMFDRNGEIHLDFIPGRTAKD
jgi:hypothetical protein